MNDSSVELDGCIDGLYLSPEFSGSLDEVMPPPLYRGVPKNSPRGIDARIRWYVRPRGTSTDYVGHVLGTVPLDADVISWTYDEKVARRFGEVVLKIDEDDVRARIVPHPLPNRYPHEREVLIRGEITGFQIV